MFTLRKISKMLLNKYDTIEEYKQQADEKCEEIHGEFSILQAEDHIYLIERTKEELGLDEELIETLLEDYVQQILTTIPTFRKLIKELQKHFTHEKLGQLRDLAHKNLGVARNLRIQDAQKILQILMKEDDLDTIMLSLDYLEACAIKLKPEVAYKIYTSK